MAEKVCPDCSFRYTVPDWLVDSAKCPQCSGNAPAKETPKQEPDQSGPSPHDVFSGRRPAETKPPSSSPPNQFPSQSPAAHGKAGNGGRDYFQSLLNDARARSLLAGALGGLVGWILAETIVGGPVGFGSTLAYGFLVGLGIAAFVGVSEGAAIGSWDRARRGLAIGACVGAVGGAIGANFGQLTYQLTNRSIATASNASREGANVGSFIRPTFSPEVADRIAREGGEAGEIEIALIWENRNDLDLHVIDPSGTEIFFGKKRSHTGGWLDIDQNAACGSVTNKPIEHIRWRENRVPAGRFVVYVNHYRNCGSSDPTPYRVEIKNGSEVESFRGQITHGLSRKRIHTFTRAADISDDKTVNNNISISPSQSKGTAPILGFLGVVLGWILFGGAVGCAEGLTRKSKLAIRNAVLGGAVGGGVGGVLLLLLAGIQSDADVMNVHSGWLARLLGFVILGAAIGFFMVVVERALSATLFIRNGQYEGREIFLDKAEMRIGRNDALEIYLGGDSAIERHHATVVKEPAAHAIQAVDGSLSIGGKSAKRVSLSDGDVVQIGSIELVYKQKKQRNLNR